MKKPISLLLAHTDSVLRVKIHIMNSLRSGIIKFHLPEDIPFCSTHCPRSSHSWLLRILQFQLQVTSSETSLITHVKHTTQGMIKHHPVLFYNTIATQNYLKLPCTYWLIVCPHLPTPRRALFVLLTIASQHLKFLILGCSKSFCE